jgi:hypothetical protein
MSSLSKIIAAPFLRTKTLFEGTTDPQFNGWFTKIANKPNILVLLKLKNGYIIAGFSEDPLDK